MVDSGGTTVFVTLGSSRYSKYSQRAEIDVSTEAPNGGAAEVELVVTMVHTKYDTENSTANYSQSYAIPVGCFFVRRLYCIVDRHWHWLTVKVAT